MPGIFISYRREDTAGHAGRLFDRLRQHFGKDRVFMDVAGIEPGADFAEAIEKAVGSCAVLLLVIGREWSSCTDQSGRRRLDDPNDFVRLEIASALNRTVRVIPVLVEGAVMPTQEVLPDDVKLLARRNAVELRDTRWDADVQDLATRLDKILPQALSPPVEPGPRSSQPSVPEPTHGQPTPQGAQPARRSKPALWLGVGVIALVVAVVAWSFWPRSPRVSRELVVPDVVGKPPDEARHAIERAGLKTGGIAREPVPGTSPGTVVRQEPPGGTRLSPAPGAEQEGTVALTVAEEPPLSLAARVEVPDLVGKGLDLALERLKSVGLGVGSREGKPSRDVPPHQVLSQTPKPGILVDRGTPVNLVFALKPAVTVPNVYKRPLAEALARLEQAGLKRGRIQEVPSSSTAAGHVVRQEPKAGAEAAAGTDVDLWVTARAAPAEVTVPDVRRLSLREADLALAKQKLRLGRVTYRETHAAPDTVLNQKPAAGQPANQGTPVDLLVARRAEPDLPEDCLSFNPVKATVGKIGDRWKIMDGRQVLFDFAANDAEARRSLDIIKHYRMNQSCLVGRPDPSFTYLLASGRAPKGALSGEDCISFNPNNLQVTEIGGRWKIVEGNDWFFDFAGNRAEAEQALGLIKRYGFTNSCCVGRPGPSFTYLRW